MTYPDRLTQHRPYLDHLINFSMGDGRQCDCEPEIGFICEPCVIGGVLQDLKWFLDVTPESWGGRLYAHVDLPH